MATKYPMPTAEWIEKTMKSLELTREEALEMWMDDHDIDAGKVKPFDLDPAKQKVVKEMTKAVRVPANYSLEGKPKRERKPNEEKREILRLLAEAVAGWQELAEQVETVNPERQVDFHVGDNHYSLTLTCHRKPKQGKA